MSFKATDLQSYHVQDQGFDYFGTFLWHMLLLYITIIACLFCRSVRESLFYVSSWSPSLKRRLTTTSEKEREKRRCQRKRIKSSAKVAVLTSNSLIKLIFLSFSYQRLELWLTFQCVIRWLCFLSMTPDNYLQPLFI